MMYTLNEINRFCYFFGVISLFVTDDYIELAYYGIEVKR